jgi:general stress protein 26
MVNDEIKQAALDLMDKAEIAYLSTIDPDGFPSTRAIFNLRNSSKFPSLVPIFAPHGDDFLIYFGTNTSSRKMTHIRENPAVAVYDCRPDEFHGLMLGGKIEIVHDPEIKKVLWQKGWERYYPTGYNDPDYTVLRLKPLFAQGWYKAANFEFRLG